MEPPEMLICWYRIKCDRCYINISDAYAYVTFVSISLKPNIVSSHGWVKKHAASFITCLNKTASTVRYVAERAILRHTQCIYISFSGCVRRARLGLIGAVVFVFFFFF